MSSPTDQAQANDEIEVRALYQNMLESWNRRKADEIAALYTADANVVGFDGSQMNGRAEIALFQNTPAQFHGRPDSAQQLTDELRELVRAGLPLSNDRTS